MRFLFFVLQDIKEHKNSFLFCRPLIVKYRKLYRLNCLKTFHKTQKLRVILNGAFATKSFICCNVLHNKCVGSSSGNILQLFRKVTLTAHFSSIRLYHRLNKLLKIMIFVFSYLEAPLRSPAPLFSFISRFTKATMIHFSCLK